MVFTGPAFVLVVSLFLTASNKEKQMANEFCSMSNVYRNSACYAQPVVSEASVTPSQTQALASYAENSSASSTANYSQSSFNNAPAAPVRVAVQNAIPPSPGSACKTSETSPAARVVSNHSSRGFTSLEIGRWFAQLFGSHRS